MTDVRLVGGAMEERRDISRRAAIVRRIINQIVAPPHEVSADDLRPELSDDAIERIMRRLVQSGLAEAAGEGRWVKGKWPTPDQKRPGE